MYSCIKKKQNTSFGSDSETLNQTVQKAATQTLNFLQQPLASLKQFSKDDNKLLVKQLQQNECNKLYAMHCSHHYLKFIFLQCTSDLNFKSC